MSFRSLVIAAFSAATLATVALADPQPIPGSWLATQPHYMANPSFPNLIGEFPAGYGGSFRATLYQDQGGATGAQTTSVSGSQTIAFWCVDYQLDIEPGDNYEADITPLSQITQPTDSQVRYGNIDQSTGTPSWTNALAPASLPTWALSSNTAAYRYALAAALVDQYDSGSLAAGTTVTPGSGDPIDVANSLRNQEIQAAIWDITFNNDCETATTPCGASSTVWPPSGFTQYLGVNSNTFMTAVSNWVTWAENNVTSVNLNSWAVISGPAESNGTLDSPGGVYQTFLVQVSGFTTNGNGGSPLPEPSYYAILAGGLALLFVGARFRKRHKELGLSSRAI